MSRRIFDFRLWISTPLVPKSETRDARKNKKDERAQQQKQDLKQQQQQNPFLQQKKPRKRRRQKQHAEARQKPARNPEKVKSIFWTSNIKNLPVEPAKQVQGQLETEWDTAGELRRRK